MNVYACTNTFIQWKVHSFEKQSQTKIWFEIPSPKNESILTKYLCVLLLMIQKSSSTRIYMRDPE